MAVIELFTFRLSEGVDEAAFLAADQRVQTEFMYHQPGLARRTTARAGDGEWLCVLVWGAAADADRAATIASEHPATKAFAAVIDHDSVRLRRYTTLD